MIVTTLIVNMKDGEIGCDSRTTLGDTIISDSTKKFKMIAGEYYFFSGDVSASEAIMEFLINDVPINTNAEGIVICTDNGNVNCYNLTLLDGLTSYIIRYNQGFGSGGEWALSALDFRQNTTDAIKYAKTRDINTGGKINVFKIPEFINFL